MTATDKLDAPARHLLRGLGGTPRESAPEVAVLVRGRGAFSEDQLLQLRSSGVGVRTVANDVLSADLPATALLDLAGHDFVVAVQLATSLAPEGARPGDEPPVSYYDVE